MLRSATRGGAGRVRERSAPGGRSSSAAVTRATLPRLTHDGAADAADAISLGYLGVGLVGLVV
jgi:hypothetical protein